MSHLPRFVALGRLRFILLVVAGMGLVLAAALSRQERLWQGQDALKELERRGEKASLLAAFEAARYGTRPVDGKPETFAMVNAANGFRAEFTPLGVSLATESGRRVSVRPVGLGYGDALDQMTAAGIKADGTRVEIARTTSVSAIDEWWVNRPAGLEQGYTVEAAPGLRKPGEWLQVALAIDTDLRLMVAADGQSAELEEANGDAVFQYDHLVVTDARGRTLRSRMRATGAILSLETDDTDAVYPITIDPVWAQEAYVKASNPGAGDTFGNSVAVSGNTVVIGAPGEDSNASGVNGTQTDNSLGGAGAAYVFVRNGLVWSQQAYLKASNPGAGDSFGSVVSISGDTIVVGAVFEDSNATGVDGNQADNSAADAGAAYVFVRNGTTWSQQAYLKASNATASDRFGGFVSVSGDTIAVGAHQEDSISTGVNGDGTSNAAADSGAAYVFVRNGLTWSQEAYVKASNTSGGDSFGWSVSVSGDTLVVGAINEDSAATGVNGNQLDEGAAASGAAYVFLRNAGVWAQQAYLKAFNTGTNDLFGFSVTAAGDTVIVGALGEDGSAQTINGASDNNAADAGAAYVFVRNAGVWSQQAYLKASNASGGYSFGRSVSVSGDSAVVGSFLEDSDGTGVNGTPTGTVSDSGAAYVFTRAAGVWSQQSYMKASNTQTADQFGVSVSTTGTIVVVGANQEDSNANGINGNGANNSFSNAGAAYTFDIGGTISGTVTNQVTLAAVPNVPVSFFTSSGALAGMAQTDSSGNYTSPGLVPGEYFVRATPANGVGLIGELHNDLPCPAGTCTTLAGAKVTVTASNVTDIDFALSPSASISGAVTNAVTLSPVSGASVAIFTSTGTLITTLTTDGAGAYASPGLVTGSYLLRVTPPVGSPLIGELHNNIPCPAGTCLATGGTPVAVTGPNATVVNFALESGATISGVVTNFGNGQPVSGANVFFTFNGVFNVGSATTDGSGAYTSPALPTGSYRVRVVPPGTAGLIAQVYNNIPCPGNSCHAGTGTLLPVTAPNVTNLNFALQPGSTITGTVTNVSNGNPVAGVAVTIFSSTGVAIQTPTTDASGVYTSTGIPTGTYFVRALTGPGQGLVGRLHSGINCPGGACIVTKGTPVNVTSPNSAVVDIALPLGATMIGTVRHSVTLAPVANVTMSVFDLNGTSVASTTTGPNGGYITPALPSGQYYLRAIPPSGSGLIAEAHDDVPCPGGACEVHSGAPIVLTAPNFQAINFALDPGGTIDGIVTHANTGAPISGVSVTIFNLNWDELGTMTTDPRGAYVSFGLPAGDYYVVADPPAITGLVGQLHSGVPCAGGGCQLLGGTPIAVSPQNPASVNFALSPGGTITGVVTQFATGELISNASVRFYSADSIEIANVLTNTNGVYQSRGLPTGTYYVQVVVSAPSGLTSQMYDNAACPAGFCALSLGTPVQVTAPSQTSGIDFALVSTPAATNDDYASATVISAVPSQFMSNVSAATPNGADPLMSCGNGATNSSVWFTYTPSQSGPVGFTTFGSNYDTILAVYTGTPGNFVQVACNDDTGGSQSSVVLQGVNGQQLSILVSAYAGADYLVLNAQTAPGAPTNVSAVAGYGGKATVSFTLPLNSGGDQFTGVTITASPGGASMVAYATTVVFTGLTDYTAYTFTVTASNNVGTGPSSSPSNTVIPKPRPPLAYLDGGDAGDAFLYNPTTGDWSRRVSQPGGGFIEEGSGTWAPGWTVQRADFNSDDLTDFFLYNTTTGEWAKMLNDGNNGFTTQVTGGWWPGWQRFAIELDGDGITDFFLYDPASGIWFKCFSTPAGFDYSQSAWNPEWEIYPMRLNNDAYGDLFLISRTTGRWFWALGENGPGFTYPVSEIWFPGWQFYPGDFNGDALGDILLHDPATGIYFVATSTGSGFTFVQGGWSLGWDPYVVDFNGDLKDDLFLHDPATGVWFEMLSDGAGNFVNAGGQIWSLGWVILPSDVNGDGRGDIILYDPNTGVWYQAVNLVNGTMTYYSGNWPTGFTIVTRAPIR